MMIYWLLANQRHEDMTEILKIIYALTIWISLILVVTSHSKSFLTHTI